MKVVISLGCTPSGWFCIHTSRCESLRLDLSQMNTLSSHHRLPLFIDHRCPSDSIDSSN
jgi:hypothetical protein